MEFKTSSKTKRTPTNKTSKGLTDADKANIEKKIFSKTEKIGFLERLAATADISLPQRIISEI